MSTIRIEDVAHVRFHAPDLERMKAFLTDFGLLPFESGGMLYAKGRSGAPFAHVTTLGEPGFAGVGLRAASVDDLETLAASEATSVEALADPGGGSVVRLSDPDGFLVEVVAGQAFEEPQTLAPRPPLNTMDLRARFRTFQRVGAGPAKVLRLGHCVLNVSDYRTSERWYKDRFGLVTSDEIEMQPGQAIGGFLRCDRGDKPSDHHSLFLIENPAGPGFNHAAFEVRDVDDVMTGHDHLVAGGHRPEWGVGRHILGSQVFDYWRDPWGAILEHWTDGDLLTTDDGGHTATMEDLFGVQWGPLAPPTMGRSYG